MCSSSCRRSVLAKRVQLARAAALAAMLRIETGKRDDLCLVDVKEERHAARGATEVKMPRNDGTRVVAGALLFRRILGSA